MLSLLLVLIYVAFISLGLPDSLLGSAWPVMRLTLGAPLSYAGIITMIISASTILSSLLSDTLTRKFGAGLITAFSVFLTAAALFGFSTVTAFWQLCLFAIPYGLGAGAVDAALNNYVALRYKSRHMSWLHCFWGVGAAISPYIMSYCLTGGLGWSRGYLIVAVLQASLTAVLLLSLPLWKKASKQDSADHSTPDQPLKTPSALLKTVRIKGIPFMIVLCFAYCAAEQTTILWASSYLAAYRGFTAERAAMFASLFFLGLTVGRFLCGFIAEKAGDKRLIRLGILTVLLGVGIVALPDIKNVCPIIGLILVGLGCAPIYPSVIHSAPDHFGKENSHSAIGIQMASAHLGAISMPPLFGLIAEHIHIGLFPAFLLILTFLMLIMSELLNAKSTKHN